MSLTSAGRVAGIDYGTVRIGIALCDPSRTLASPYETYSRRGTEQDARRFQRLVAEEQVTRFVVGLPVHLDGRGEPEVRGGADVWPLAGRSDRGCRRVLR